MTGKNVVDGMGYRRTVGDVERDRVAVVAGRLAGAVGSRSLKTTVAPLSRRRSAQALPMPVAAPVTNATRPFRSTCMFPPAPAATRPCNLL